MRLVLELADKIKEVARPVYENLQVVCERNLSQWELERTRHDTAEDVPCILKYQPASLLSLSHADIHFLEGDFSPSIDAELFLIVTSSNPIRVLFCSREEYDVVDYGFISYYESVPLALQEVCEHSREGAGWGKTRSSEV